MGHFVFRLPDVGEGIAEAEIAAWHVRPGDRVEEDQSLVDVMTEKATVDMSAPVSGLVLAVHGAVGDLVPVGAPLVELEVDGAGDEPTEKPAREAQAPVSAASVAPPVFSARRPPRQAPLAAPATRRRAHELRIALEDVPGTGPGGRVTPGDIEAYGAARGLLAPASGAQAASGGVSERKIIGLRRKIAERMSWSTQHIPHFSYVEEFDMTELEALRAALNGESGESRPRLTLLPFFMRAVVLLRADFPHINAHYDEEKGVLREHEAVHIGIATRTDEGLMVPVVRHAERRDLWDCARELRRVTALARDGKAAREALTGSTLTLTSLGALGGLAATPIINAPETAILAPNKLIERPVVRDGRIVIRTLMNLSASFDHRIVDGHDAALYVQRLRQLIEQPARLFMGGAP